MNTQITIVTLFAALGAIVAYDFGDPVYNQILANDLEELDDSLDEKYLHPRSRRDEEAANADKCKDKWHRKKKFCCAEESFESAFERDKDIKKECFKQVVGKDKDKEPRGDFDPFRCDKVDKRRKEMACVFQCVGLKKNILDKDGNPIEAEIATYVKELMAKESWFAPSQEKVITTCVAEAKNATSQRDTSDDTACNPAGITLAHCFFKEIQLGCPAGEIKDEKACAKARDKIKRHEDFFGPPPPSPAHDD